MGFTRLMKTQCHLRFPQMRAIRQLTSGGGKSHTYFTFFFSGVISEYACFDANQCYLLFTDAHAPVLIFRCIRRRLF